MFVLNQFFSSPWNGSVSQLESSFASLHPINKLYPWHEFIDGWLWLVLPKEPQQTKGKADIMILKYVPMKKITLTLLKKESISSTIIMLCRENRMCGILYQRKLQRSWKHEGILEIKHGSIVQLQKKNIEQWNQYGTIPNWYLIVEQELKELILELLVMIYIPIWIWKEIFHLSNQTCT